MWKKNVFLVVALFIFAGAQGQKVDQKTCRTCGKLLKECQYKGKHPNRESNPKPSNTKIESKYLRMDGNDIVFDLNGTEYRYKMIYVEGGSYMMGAPESDGVVWWDNEMPQHSVTVVNFYMGQTEVTQALWKVVMGSNPSYWKGNTLPVENVLWDDCQEFIKKLNSLTGRTFRLPTEEEWEYATRGGSNKSPYTYSGSDTVESVAWYNGNSGSRTHPVARKQPNALGLYDMSGNVWEWCSSIYGSYHCSTRSRSNCVLRGGDWGDDARYCRVSFHCDVSPSNLGGFGLRLVMVS